jgi:hypothetical protein
VWRFCGPADCVSLVPNSGRDNDVRKIRRSGRYPWPDLMTTITRLRKRTDRRAKRLSRATIIPFSVVVALVIAVLVGLANLSMVIPNEAKLHYHAPSILRILK